MKTKNRKSSRRRKTSRRCGGGITPSRIDPRVNYRTRRQILRDLEINQQYTKQEIEDLLDYIYALKEVQKLQKKGLIPADDTVLTQVSQI